MIDAEVNIDVVVVLDLNPVFDSSLDTLDRLPNPSLLIKTFDVEGVFGVNEWSTKLELPPPLDDFQILVSEAKALVNISAGIPSEHTPLEIASKDDFIAFISPNSSKIDLSVGLDVSLPVFVIVNDFGFGATITYEDYDILDDQRSNITIETDALIEIDLIKNAATQLRDSTSFLRGTKVLADAIPLLQVSANELIAGKGRTFADLFDLTEVSTMDLV